MLVREGQWCGRRLCQALRVHSRISPRLVHKPLATKHASCPACVQAQFLDEDNWVVGPVHLPCSGEINGQKFSAFSCTDSDFWGWQAVRRVQGRMCAQLARLHQRGAMSTQAQTHPSLRTLLMPAVCPVVGAKQAERRAAGGPAPHPHPAFHARVRMGRDGSGACACICVLVRDCVRARLRTRTFFR